MRIGNLSRAGRPAGGHSGRLLRVLSLAGVGALLLAAWQILPFALTSEPSGRTSTAALSSSESAGRALGHGETPAKRPASATATRAAAPESPAAAAPAPQRTASVAPPAQGSASAAGRVDLNSASVEELNAIPGAGLIGRAIQRGRPYASPEDLVAKRILNRAAYERIKDQITAQ
jgi:DNA uptake protein ComE-like DNA-binding protein